MPRGSLRAALHDPAAREELHWRRQGGRIAVDVAEALDYMHTQQRMLHSDIKARAWVGEPWDRGIIACVCKACFGRTPQGVVRLQHGLMRVQHN